MKVTVRKIGNSHGVIIPVGMLLAARIGEQAEMTVEDGAIVLRSSRASRAGWAAASRDVASAGEGGPAWLEPPRVRPVTPDRPGTRR